MTKLKGPNIVRFHEVLGTTNNIYIVIDLCDSDLYKYRIIGMIGK